MKSIIILLFFILGIWAIIKIPDTVFNNLITEIWQRASILAGMILLLILIYKLFQVMPMINNIIKIVILLLLIGIIIIIAKRLIPDMIRIIDYYIHRKKAFKNGKIEKGKIIRVKSEDGGRWYPTRKKYHLLVDYKGKILKSIYFAKRSTYSKGKDIDVLVYKKHCYVLLKEEREKLEKKERKKKVKNMNNNEKS